MQFELRAAFLKLSLERFRMGPRNRANWVNVCEGLQEIDRVEASNRAEISALWATGVAQLTADKRLQEFADKLTELGRRLDDAREFLRPHMPPPDGAIRRIAVTMPFRASVGVVVDSGVLPGEALRFGLVPGNQAARGMSLDVAKRFGHVPDLEQTFLTNDRGDVLFSALRHSLMDMRGLRATYAEILANTELQKADPALRDAVRWRLRKSGSHVPDSVPPAARHETLRVARAAQDLRVQDLVVAALTAEQAKYSHVKDEETCVVKLSAISMLGGEDAEAWADQWLAMSNLQRKGPTWMSVWSSELGKHTIGVGIEFRYFPLSAEPEQLLPRELLDGPVKQLLGPADSPQLGGDAEASVEAMKMQASGLFDQMAAIAWGESSSGATGGGRPVDLQDRAEKLERLRVQWDRLMSNSRALEEAGQQLKDLWMVNRAWPADVRARKKVAARLALVAQLMNETPVLSCASGSNLNRTLDPSIKFLATVADNLNGKVLPPKDPDAGAWKPVRANFKPQ